MSSNEKAWADYQQAMQNLSDDRGGDFAMVEDAGDDLLEASAAMRESLADEIEMNELAEWKLLASATYDLAIAADMLDAGMEPADDRATASYDDRAVLSEVMLDRTLITVLDASLSDGVEDFIDLSRGDGFPIEMPEARDKLLEKIAGYRGLIVDNSAELSQRAVGAAIPLVGNDLVQQAAATIAQDFVASLPENAGLWLRRAAKLVAEAFNKLLTLIGAAWSEKIQEVIDDWIQKIDQEENRSLVASWLDALYQSKDIVKEVEERIVEAEKNANLTAAMCEKYAEALQTLEERNGQRKELVSKLLKVMGWIEAKLLTLVPWGPVAVYLIYASVLGYAVYSGGDYLDWYRTERFEWLDRIAGLRSVVTP